MSRQLVSPFLGREAARDIRNLSSARPDARMAMERHKARLLLERLRYRAYARNGSLSRFMQHLGDWGRKYVAIIRFRY